MNIQSWLEGVAPCDILHTKGSRKRRASSSPLPSQRPRLSKPALPLSPETSDNIMKVTGDGHDEAPRAKRRRVTEDVNDSETGSLFTTDTSQSARSQTARRIQQLEVAEEGALEMQQIDIDNPLMPEGLCRVVKALDRCARGLNVVHPDLKVCFCPYPLLS